MNITHSIALLLAAASLSCCNSPSSAPDRPPLAGASIGGPFTLTDQDGDVVTDRQFKGQYRIMYFGYTFCPDVCPTDMQNVGAGLRLLEKSDPVKAAMVTPIFVTVDPERDTPSVLKQFVRNFHPRMIGLTGSQPVLEKVDKEYAVYHAKGDPSPGGGYLVNHTRQAYLMGPAGQPIALVPVDENPKAVAESLERWIT